MKDNLIRFFGLWTVLMAISIVWNAIFKGHGDYLNAGVTSLGLTIGIFIYLHYQEKKKQ